MPAGGGGGGSDALHHGAGALLAVDQHVALAQHRDVRVGRGDVERRGREEAVTARAASAGDAGEADVEHLVAVERDQPLHRTAEGGVAGAPAHRLAEGDLAAQGAERRAEQLVAVAPGLLATTDDEAPGLLLADRLFRFDAQSAHRQAELLREGLGGARGGAVLVGRGLGRSDHLLVEIELAVADVRAPAPTGGAR